MPTDFLSADSSFPNLEGKTQDEKIAQLTSYLYMLLEQLRYSLSNLGQENFNTTELETLTETIRQPIYVQLEDTEKGLSTQLNVLNGNFNAVFEGVDWNNDVTKYTKVVGDINGIYTEVYDEETGKSRIEQNATAITAEVENRKAAIASSINQTMNSITLSVTNQGLSSIIKLSANKTEVTSAKIEITGAVTFSDLYNKNDNTVINGDNIRTGQINAIDIVGSTITGATITGSIFASTLTNDSETQGRIDFYYLATQENMRVGSLYVSDEGTAPNNAYRVILETFEWGGDSPFVLKLKSADNMSAEAKGTIYFSGKEIWLTANGGTTSGVTFKVQRKEINNVAYAHLATSANYMGIIVQSGAQKETIWSFRSDGIYCDGTKKVSA